MSEESSNSRFSVRNMAIGGVVVLLLVGGGVTYMYKDKIFGSKEAEATAVASTEKVADISVAVVDTSKPAGDNKVPPAPLPRDSDGRPVFDPKSFEVQRGRLKKANVDSKPADATADSSNPAGTPPAPPAPPADNPADTNKPADTVLPRDNAGRPVFNATAFEEQRGRLKPSKVDDTPAASASEATNEIK